MSGVILSSFRPRLGVSVTWVGTPTSGTDSCPAAAFSRPEVPPPPAWLGGVCSVIHPPMQPHIFARGAAESDGAFDS